MARSTESMLLVMVLGALGCGPSSTEQYVPRAEPAAIHAFLTSRSYADWDGESRVLPGLNDTGRRIFLSELADHERSPVGAGAVREIYDGPGQGAELIGWSALVKVDDTGESNRDWFFYETFEPESAEGFSIAARDATGCTFCHGSAPDTIQSRRPLR